MFNRLLVNMGLVLLVGGAFYSPNVQAKSWLESILEKGAAEKLCKKQRKSIKKSLKSLKSHCKEGTSSWKKETLCFREEISFLIGDLGDSRNRDSHERGHNYKNLSCHDVNLYGMFAKGGGCNTYGCWYPKGGCNTYGCWYSKGGCNVYGCWAEGGRCQGAGCIKKARRYRTNKACVER